MIEEAPSLLDALDEMIAVRVRVGSWVEAVRVAGQLLVRGGRVRPEYIDAMIKVVEELGPYAVVAPGVAIPHARPEDGALDIGVSIAVLETPVEFNSPNDPVYVVIGFSARDRASHLRIVSELAAILEKEWIVEELRKARSIDDVKRAIEKALSKP